jgi:Uri superfamily endonuclease
MPGTYALVFSASAEKSIPIGRLGLLDLRPGFYVYVGSAFGPGGVQARIRHHLQKAHRPHWHIDFLQGYLSAIEVWFSHDHIRHEHRWADMLQKTRGASTILPGFGSSDCRCRTHLFFFRAKPSGGYFRKRIRAACREHAAIKIKKLLDKNQFSDIH